MVTDIDYPEEFQNKKQKPKKNLFDTAGHARRSKA